MQSTRLEDPPGWDHHLRSLLVQETVVAIRAIEAENHRGVQLARRHQLRDPGRPVLVERGSYPLVRDPESPSEVSEDGSPTELRRDPAARPLSADAGEMNMDVDLEF